MPTAPMLNAMFTVAGLWLAAFCVIAGLGQIVRRGFGLAAGNLAAWFESFWVGYALGIGLLEYSHLVLPIDWRVTLAIATVGIVAFVIALVATIRQFGKTLFTRQTGLFVLAFAVLLLPFAYWLSNRALDPQVEYDTALYHLSTIRWANEYPVVIGLGNLHYRLAFNQSSFLFVAALNIYPFFNNGMKVGNSFLVMVTVAQLLVYVLMTLRDARKNLNVITPHNLLSALFLPVMVYRATKQKYSGNISSPSPDLGVFVLQIVLSLAIVRYLFAPAGPDPKLAEREKRFTLLSIFAIAAVGTTGKLSFVMFAVVSVAIMLIVWLSERRSTMMSALRQAIIILGIIGTVVGGGWIANGIVTSGYILFPTRIGALPVDYRVPESIRYEAENWVYAFARDPRGDMEKVLHSWDWLPTWSRSLGDSFNQFLFVIPLQVAGVNFVAIIALLILLRITGKPAPDQRLWLLLLPAIASGVFWFFSAPDPRFSGSVFWILALWLAVILNWTLRPFIPRWSTLVIIGCSLMVAAWILVNGYGTFRTAGSGFPPVTKPILAQYKTNSGLTVYINPEQNLLLWDAPLPASPYKYPELELRGDTLRDGFRLPIP